MMKATRKTLLNWAPNYVEPIQENEDVLGKQFTSTKNGCPKKKKILFDQNEGSSQTVHELQTSSFSALIPLVWTILSFTLVKVSFSQTREC